MMHRNIYRFQLRPTAAQTERLYQMAGAKRFVFNWALARRKDHYAEHKEGLSAKMLSAELTALKKQPDTAWLKGVDSQLLQQALKDVDRAYQTFFEKRSRYPRFKTKRRETPSFCIPQRVKVEGGRVYVSKVGWVKLRQSQPVDCPTKSATFKRDACGKWYVTLTAEFEMPDVPLQPADPKQVIGVDLGLKDFAVFSTGERIAPPKHYRQLERRLAEDLSLKGMVRTKLSKSVLDAALAEFRRQLEYKAAWNRTHLAVVDRWYPSTKLCRACGTLNDALMLSMRTWTCECGVEYDRDLNAAQNIRAEGLTMLAVGHTESLNACGAGVRPHHQGQSALKQESHLC